MASRHLLTLEEQLKACGCVVVLIIALGGIAASIWTIIYSFQGWREYDMDIYTNDVLMWNETEHSLFEGL
mgnify:CR=1 FL=1